ncbi:MULTISPECIES: class A beta-lactamase [Thermomonosporaceae]|uniref:class A beta-lactamase n=1 Tax=Thermomonosporaceae TaxID=2012 RepID=UPI00255A96FD|nr:MULTISPECIES: class A beta-lactamase [Thermomonosporaceae]MDL4772389.1 class A beta-lactamase [Actinomadura xylanilytica]
MLGSTTLAVATAIGLAGCGTTSAPAVPQSAKSQITVDTSRPGEARAAQATVERRLRELEKSYQGRIGAFAVDTGTGRVVSHRADERFPMLSTFKTMAASAVLRKARESDPGLINRVVYWKDSEVVDNSPVTKDHVKSGLTIAQLCEAAITQSDNTAGNMLLKQIGGPAGLTRFLRSIKDPVSRLDRWETDLNIWKPGQRGDTTTPGAMGRNLRGTTVGGTLTAPDQARLNGWLRGNLTGDERIRAGVPKGWVVGDKTGTAGNYGAANDIAVAWPPSGAPVIISIYTNRDAAAGTTDNTVISRTASILVSGLGKTR